MGKFITLIATASRIAHLVSVAFVVANIYKEHKRSDTDAATDTADTADATDTTDADCVDPSWHHVYPDNVPTA